MCSDMFYVYVLKCNDGTLYTGYTNDVKKRLDAHKSGNGARYTRARLPVKLLKKWNFSTKSKAMKYEIYFKKLTRKRKIAIMGL